MMCGADAGKGFLNSCKAYVVCNTLVRFVLGFLLGRGIRKAYAEDALLACSPMEWFASWSVGNSQHCGSQEEVDSVVGRIACAHPQLFVSLLVTRYL